MNKASELTSANKTASLVLSPRRVLLLVGLLCWTTLILRPSSLFGTQAIFGDSQDRTGIHLFYRHVDDPRLGQPVPGADVLSKITTSPGNAGFVLVAVGDCQSCTYNTFDPTTLPTLRGWTYVIVAGSGRTDAVLLNGSNSAHLRMELPSSQYAGLIATWSPRLFKVDRSGALLGSQSANEPLELFLQRSVN